MRGRKRLRKKKFKRRWESFVDMWIESEPWRYEWIREAARRTIKACPPVVTWKRGRGA